LNVLVDELATPRIPGPSPLALGHWRIELKRLANLVSQAAALLGRPPLDLLPHVPVFRVGWAHWVSPDPWEFGPASGCSNRVRFNDKRWSKESQSPPFRRSRNRGSSWDDAGSGLLRSIWWESIQAGVAEPRRRPPRAVAGASAFGPHAQLGATSRRPRLIPSAVARRSRPRRA
jgi:hypothetical protein